MMNFERQRRKSRSTNRVHRITVRRITRTTTADGDSIPEVKIIGSYWASVDPIREEQRREYQTIGTECTHFIRCDAKIDIKETDEIIFKNRKFEILTIIDLHEMGRDKLITSKEIRPNHE